MCQETLTMAERQGVEIDYCPKCRGVWLDRGELEKLIERSYAPTQAAAPPPKERWQRDDDHDDDDYRDRRDRPRNDGKYKKRESWLSDLFDFG